MPTREGAETPSRRRATTTTPAPSPRSTRPERRETRSEDSGRSSGRSSGKGGWEEVAKRQKAAEARKKEMEDGKGAIRDFWLKTGESSVVQFLDDEPYILDGHNIKDGEGNWKFEPCQTSRQKHCLMCREKIKSSWKAVFKILDYRGKWDKDAKEFTWDEPVEKVWILSQTILGQLQTTKTKRGKPLTELVLEVTRTGSSKTDTSYNFETAFDDKDRKLAPLDWESEFPEAAEVVAAKSDDELIDMGFSAPADK